MRLPRRGFLAAVCGAFAVAAAGCSARRPAGAGDVQGFMQRSKVLTGYDDLDPDLGAAYLHALQAAPPETGALASASDAQILAMWYSGTYAAGGSQRTQTWTQALAWRACAFTKPPSVCGMPGAWARPPG